MRTASKGLSKAQKALLSLVLIDKLPISKACVTLGHSQSIWYQWLKKDSFAEAVKKGRVLSLQAQSPSVDNALLQSASDPSPKSSTDRRLFYEIIGDIGRETDTGVRINIAIPRPADTIPIQSTQHGPIGNQGLRPYQVLDVMAQGARSRGIQGEGAPPQENGGCEEQGEDTPSAPISPTELVTPSEKSCDIKDAIFSEAPIPEGVDGTLKAESENLVKSDTSESVINEKDMAGGI